MALDACMVRALTCELSEKLTPAKIEKIHQPERDEIDLYLRAGGRPVRLALLAAPGSPRIYLSRGPRENPAVPPMFCTLLRKHLAGGVLRSVEQIGFERAVIFTFSARDEMGFETTRKIICEMMGKYSNLIFTDAEDVIIGILRPVDFTASEKRQLLTGMRYTLPPAQEGKIDPLEETREGFLQKAAAANDRPADKFLLERYSGFSPLTVREIAFCASGMTDCATGAYAQELYSSFDALRGILKSGAFSPCAVRVGENAVEFSSFSVRQYGAQAQIVPFESPSELIETFYEEKERAGRIRRRAQDLYKLLNNADSRLGRKIDAQQKEIEACAEKETYRRWAELITANLYALKKGDEEVKLVDYYSPELETVCLRLDKRLSPAANAQRYFKRYSKLKTAETELAVQIAKAREEQIYVRSVLDALDRAALPSDVEEIRRELVRGGYLSDRKTPPSRKPSSSGFLVYRTPGGMTVLCGKNNLQNDLLSFEKADRADWWFHVHSAPGSHVVLVCDGEDDPPASEFTAAAMIAAVNSSLCRGKGVIVDYTRVRNLKKPPHAKPGFVIYHTNFSAVVDPDAEAVKGMLVP